MHSKHQSEAPHCPDHAGVKMVRMNLEPRRNFKIGRWSKFLTRTIKELRDSPRWKCPVAGCNRCHVDDDLISRG
jgi:hypothetical protein